MSKNKENFLDYIPRPNKLFETHENEKGHIEIVQENKGFYNKIAQKLFKKPRFSNIELDDMGSFIFRQMDGVKTVYEIGQNVKEEFGDEAEPLYERLSQFIKILHENHYVVYQNKITS